MFSVRYSAVHGFRPVEKLAVLAAGPTGCSEGARGGCLFASNFNFDESAVPTVVERRHLTKRVATLVTRP